jgi:cation diffusion facilitator family transporter
MPPTLTFGASAEPRPRSIAINLIVALAQTAALAGAAVLTGSAALRTQTVTSSADVAGGVFLVIGVIGSARKPDDRHPLGYGRERFFWSFVAAIGIFIGGFGVGFAETIQAYRHPQPAAAYLVGYAVLGVVTSLDAVALIAGLRPLRRRAVQRAIPLAAMLWRGTDPAVTTVVLSSTAGVAGGVLACAGLAARQLSGNAVFDALASGLISLVLLATSIVLLHTNRELLTGRGLPPERIERLREIVEAQAGVLGVPDIFALVVGPSTLIVDGDVVFDDHLDVPAVEVLIATIATALRDAMPAIAYVYLNPVAAHRPRRRPPRTYAIEPASAPSADTTR